MQNNITSEQGEGELEKDFNDDNFLLCENECLYNALLEVKKSIDNLLKFKQTKGYKLLDGTKKNHINENNKINEILIIRESLIKELIELCNGISYPEDKLKILKKLNLFIDPITLLPNQDQLNIDIEILKGKKIILFIKIVDFRKINTIYKLDESEEILQQIINELKQIFEEIGFDIYSIDSTTFGFLKEFGDEDINQLIKKIDNIISLLSILEIINKKNIYLNFIGGLSYNDNASFENTYIALDNSNISRNKRLTVYTDELGWKNAENYIEANQWQKIIKEAIQKGWIIPFFQTIKNNETGEMDHVEALMRCYNGKNETGINDPDDNNFYTPGEFFKYIKDTPLMRELTIIMIEKTITKMKNYNYSFSLNIGEKEIMDNGIINLILEKLKENNIEASRLTIEILEENELSEKVILRLKHLQKIGFKIAIDDFGTGFSTLMRVIKMKYDVKIDKSLINGTYKDLNIIKLIGKLFRNFRTNTSNEFIKSLNVLNEDNLLKIKESQAKLIFIIAIVITSNILGTKIYAEGIEDLETQELIKKLGIKHSQGFLFSKPSRNI